jgi:hypothetical protein
LHSSGPCCPDRNVIPAHQRGFGVDLLREAFSEFETARLGVFELLFLHQ